MYVNVHPKSEDSLVQGPAHVGADYTWKESGSNTVHGSITRCSAVLILIANVVEHCLVVHT